MKIRHDEKTQQFLLEADGPPAVLIYRMEDSGTIHFTSTYVPSAYRGRGFGAWLVKAGLDHARERGFQVTTSCWFVDEFLDRTPEYQDLRAE